MKKKKGGFILSIVSICLSIFAIAFGVYALTTAKLSISGSIGFTLHDCKLSVSAYMYGHSLTQDGKPTTLSNKTYLIDKNNEQATEESPYVVCDNDGGLSFNINNGNVYFSNLSSTGKPQPIVIVVKITNVSSNVIYFEDTTAVATEYSVICDDPLKVLYADDVNNTCTITYTLTLKANSDGSYSNLTTPVNLTLGMNFSKLDTSISSTGFTLSGTTITDVPAKNTSDLLVIPSKFSDKSDVTYTTLGTDVISNLKGYSKVIILDGITSIGGYVFSECGDSLTAVCIPESVTRLDSSFIGCASLTSVKLPNSLKILNYMAFSGCTSLVSINIPYGVTNISNVFDGCTSLTQIIIPDSVTVIGGSAFDGCTNLTTITLPSKLNLIEYNAFKNCSNLSSITIPSSVTEIQFSAFSGCTKLKSITFEKTDNWQYSTDNGTTYNDLPSSMSLASPSANATNFIGSWVNYCFKQK